MITINISGGPSFTVNYTNGMNGQDALEAAFNSVGSGNGFTFSLQYYGSNLGYLVDMINETYDTFISSYEPYYFWQFLINGNPSSTGIDNTVLKDGDAIEFQYVTYNVEEHANSTLEAKYKVKKISSV